MSSLWRVAVAVVVGIGLAPATAVGQQPVKRSPLARGDVAGTVGWLSGEIADLGAYRHDHWFNQGVDGGATLGWYWTDHVKTELEIGRSSSGELYSYDDVRWDAYPVFRPVRRQVTATHLVLTQRYQFRRNVFFHPHVGVGVDLAWERVSGFADAAVIYDPVTRGPVEVEPARALPAETELRPRLVTEAGFKAYLSQRVFFRSDLRLAWRAGVDRALLRFGFGVDF